MITGLYASLCGFLMIKLALNVIGLRRAYKVRLGDGGHDGLQAAIRTHGNASEYIPIVLLLMLLLELAGGFWWLIHSAGICLITGRLIHARALKHNNIDMRVIGMKITLYLIMALSALNISYFLYNSYLNNMA